jgi:hypothetical protein
MVHVNTLSMARCEHHLIPLLPGLRLYSLVFALGLSWSLTGLMEAILLMAVLLNLIF